VIDLAAITGREMMRDALANAMRADDEMILFANDVEGPQASFSVNDGLLDAFGPMRAVDLKETADVVADVAIGAASAGMRVVVDIGNWGKARASLDPIITLAADCAATFRPASIVFRGSNGPAGADGLRDAHCLASWLAQVPGLTVIAPASPSDAVAGLLQGLDATAPTVLLEHHGLMRMQPQSDASGTPAFTIGKSRLMREGGDMTLVSYSHALCTILAAADVLAEHGVAASVLDLGTLRPLDIEPVVESVVQTGRLMTVEDAWGFGSVGTEVCQRVTERLHEHLKVPPRRLCGTCDDSSGKYPKPEDVVAAAQSILQSA